MATSNHHRAGFDPKTSAHEFEPDDANCVEVGNCSRDPNTHRVEKDDIYSLPLREVGDFQFDERVVRVFPDMISRSVPGYASILSMIGELASRYAVPGGNIYDLGCSLGACTRVIASKIPPDCTIHAVDSSQAMIDELTSTLSASQPPCEVKPARADIREVPIHNAGFSVLNFTLQFIPRGERQSLLEKIAGGTVSGGALVLSEKIDFPDKDQSDLMIDLHHAFKRAHGYSELEIAQKRSALENTLIPETLDTHLDRLRKVGFGTAACWFQCFNFVSILAVK